jgi:hypothetical protein
MTDWLVVRQRRHRKERIESLCFRSRGLLTAWSEGNTFTPFLDEDFRGIVIVRFVSPHFDCAIPAYNVLSSVSPSMNAHLEITRVDRPVLCVLFILIEH